jgi:hypothetical protein
LKASACAAALPLAAGAWLGCTGILGDFSLGAADAGEGGSDDGPAADQFAPDTGTEASGPDCRVSGTCPPGTSCSSSTQCASGVCGSNNQCAAPDCAIDASCALGAACANSGGCASGNCVDGVCCNVSACPQCTNCGSTGMCDQPVKGKDDTTPTTCSLDSTCDATGSCIKRWVKLGSDSNLGYYSPLYSFSLGTKLYYAYTGGMWGFDSTTSTFISQPKDQSMCWCGGWPAIMASGTTAYSLWDSSLDSWAPGATSWSMNVAGYEPNSTSGSGLAVVGSKVYAIGGYGSGNSAVTSVYVAAPPGTGWSAVAPLPAALSAPCTAVDSATSTVYVFSGSSNQQNSAATYAYSVASNTWSTLSTSGAPTSCFSQSAVFWQGKVAYADSQGIHQFDPSAKSWSATTLPLPQGSWQYPVVYALSDGHLYLLVYDGTNDVVYRWNLN